MKITKKGKLNPGTYVQLFYLVAYYYLLSQVILC